MKPQSGVTFHTTHLGGAPEAPPSLGTASRSRMPKNMRVTLNLPGPLLDRMRNTVYWTPGLTLTGLIKGAIQEAIEGYEQQRGQPFPLRLSELKSGRPRKRSALANAKAVSEPARTVRMPERGVAVAMAALGADMRAFDGNGHHSS